MEGIKESCCKSLGKKNYQFQSYYMKDDENITRADACVDAIFSNERIKKEYGHSISNKHINHSMFNNMGLDNLMFKDCDFKYCTFVDCYFKRSQFHNVDFVGCKFINCNLSDISLIACDFRYVKFEGCYIKFKLLFKSLPMEENLRWQLCVNLYTEAKKLGYYDEYKPYYFEAKKSSAKYEIKKMFHTGEEKKYYSKYTWRDRFDGVFNYLRLQVDKYVWGYGESIVRLIISALILILIFSLIRFMYLDSDFSASIIESINNFVGLSNTTPILNWTSQFTLSVLERFSGLVFTGLFISAIYKYINRG